VALEGHAEMRAIQERMSAGGYQYRGDNGSEGGCSSSVPVATCGPCTCTW
jgi:hypothetical protein